MKPKIILIGAGSAQFGLGTLGDIFQSEVLEGSEIVLHDINPQALAKVAKIAQAHIEKHDLPYTLSATTERQEALQDTADRPTACVISIEVGQRFELWEQDWKVPLQCGIQQVFGENGGPGGLFHSLRIIPPILEICDDIAKVCPEAYVFNFSNPMSRICTTVHRKYPDLRFIGLCHEITSLHMHLPQILGVPYENLHMRAGGLNHFSVLLEATYRETGEDAYPEIRAKAPAYFAHMPSLGDMMKYYNETGKFPEAEDLANIEVSTETWPERGLFKLILEKYGYLPITTDSHFGEYIQWAYEVVDHESILDFYRFYKWWCLEGKEPEIGDRLTERVVPMFEGILTDGDYEEAAVNIPNTGFIDDLPSWIAVEVPAIVNKDGVHGVKLGVLPKGFAGLLLNQVAVHDLTAEAVLTGSRDLVLQALLADPVVHSVHAAEQTLDIILELQAEYLDYLE